MSDYDMIQEDDVPPFVRRVGDTVYQGSNNSILIFGTDRAKDGPAKIGDGLGTLSDGGKGKKTGTIHLIVGRQDKDGNPDFKKDSAFIYLTMKTKLDTNLKVDLKGDAKIAADNDVAGAIVKSDHVRLMARKNVKILLEDSTNFVAMDKDKVCVSLKDGKNYVMMEEKKTTINVGDNTVITLDGDGKKITVKSKDKVVIDAKECHLTGGCEKPWDEILKKLIDFDEQHNHPTPVGPSGPGMSGPASSSPDSALKQAKSDWDSKVK